MKILLFCTTLLVLQTITMQQKPVIHLSGRSDSIDTNSGGKILELLNAPATVRLPVVPPKLDAKGSVWSLDVKNLGPRLVTITGKTAFMVQVKSGETIHVVSNGNGYLLKY